MGYLGIAGLGNYSISDFGLQIADVSIADFGCSDFDEFVKSHKINLLSFRRTRLCRNQQNHAHSYFCHFGLDPESIVITGD